MIVKEKKGGQFFNLIQGDCLKEMQNIESNSVDFILTDLPYGTTACSWDEIIPFETVKSSPEILPEVFKVVDVIPEGKEKEYLTLEQSAEVKRRAKRMLPGLYVIAVLFVLMIITTFIEQSSVLIIVIAIFTVIDLIYIGVTYYSLGKYIKSIS